MDQFRSQDGWRFFTREQSDELGLWPNKIAYNARTNEGDLVVHQSTKYTEYAVGENGLKHLQKALKSGRITAADVVLINLDEQEVTRKSVSEVAAMVQNLPPRKGDYGRYWLFNADLTPYDASKAPW